MKKKAGDDKQPDLEAHFADGAWYDVILSASDPTRDRFLVQAKDFPEEQEWVESGVIRPQSLPFEDPPEIGSTVLALHRSQRSDLFFEGVVKDICSSNTCRVLFTEGRVRGHCIRIPLDDINKTSGKRFPASTLRGWCTHQKAVRAPPTPQVMEFKEGDFVFIEGPDDGCWVAQLMEPYMGKISDEVDDVDDDGPLVSLRWLYRPNELPKAKLREFEVDWSREVFITYHRDTIDARLIVKKCRVAFSADRPGKNYDWKEDELFACRTWDPAKKKVKPLDDPTLDSEFKEELQELMAKFPFRKSHGKRLFSGEVSAEHTQTGVSEDSIPKKKELFSGDAEGGEKKGHGENGIDKSDRKLRRDTDKQERHSSENGADPSESEEKIVCKVPENGRKKKARLFHPELSSDEDEKETSKSPPIDDEKKSKGEEKGEEKGARNHATDQTDSHDEGRKRKSDLDQTDKSEKPEKSSKHDRSEEKASKHDKSDHCEKSEKKEKKEKTRTRRSADSDLVKQFVEQSRTRSPEAQEADKDQKEPKEHRRSRKLHREGDREETAVGDAAEAIETEKEQRRARKLQREEEAAAAESRNTDNDKNEDVDQSEMEKSEEKPTEKSRARSPKKKRAGSPTRQSGRFGRGREKSTSGVEGCGEAATVNGDDDLESPMAGPADTESADSVSAAEALSEQTTVADVAPENVVKDEKPESPSVADADLFEGEAPNTGIKEEPETEEAKEIEIDSKADNRYSINDDDDMPAMGIKEDSMETDEKEDGEKPANPSPEIEWIPTVKVTRSKLRTSNDGASPADLDVIPGARVKGKKKRNRWMTQGSSEDQPNEGTVERKKLKLGGDEDHSDGSEDTVQACTATEDKFEQDLASKWKFIDCRLVAEQEAVQEFLLESVKQVCSAVVSGCEVKPVAYFLHSTGRKAHERNLTSVGIAAAFRSTKVQDKCTKYLQDYRRKKEALAAIVVAEERSIASPTSSDSDVSMDKQPDGICLQLECPHMRRIWHLTPGVDGACCLKELHIEDKGIVGPLFVQSD